MLGPAADELAEMWRDQVRVYRYERQMKLLEKVERIAMEAGFTPKAVPPKILFPLLEGASFEDDENIHDMWAALLANAASPENAGKVRPGFIPTLKEMAHDDATLLNWIYDRHSMGDIYVNPSEANVGDLGVRLDGREASQLIRRSDLISAERSFADLTGRSSKEPVPSSRAAVFADRTDKTYLLTDRGRAFVEACRPPKSKT